MPCRSEETLESLVGRHRVSRAAVGSAPRQAGAAALIRFRRRGSSSSSASGFGGCSVAPQLRSFASISCSLSMLTLP